MKQRLKKLRKERRLTLEEVGNIFGVARGYVSRLESGDVGLSEEWIDKYCKAFRVTPNDLFEEYHAQSDSPVPYNRNMLMEIIDEALDGNGPKPEDVLDFYELCVTFKPQNVAEAWEPWYKQKRVNE